jgi:hypothetical protein
LLPFSGWELHHEWIEFAHEQSTLHKNRAVTRDLWIQLIQFMQQYPNKATVNAFNPTDSAWPNLIDEFCERIKDKI